MVKARVSGVPYEVELPDREFKVSEILAAVDRLKIKDGRYSVEFRSGFNYALYMMESTLLNNENPVWTYEDNHSR